jgi:hypothetical protein
MIKFLFCWTIRRIAKKAQRMYNGPGENGELFNTACFQNVCGTILGFPNREQSSFMLEVAGFYKMSGGCHWTKEKYYV